MGDFTSLYVIAMSLLVINVDILITTGVGQVVNSVRSEGRLVIMVRSNAPSGGVTLVNRRVENISGVSRIDFCSGRRT